MARVARRRRASAGRVSLPRAMPLSADESAAIVDLSQQAAPPFEQDWANRGNPAQSFPDAAPTSPSAWGQKEMNMKPHALRLAAAAAAIGIMSLGTLTQASAQAVPHSHASGYARTYRPPAYQDHSCYGYSYGGYGGYGGYTNRGGCSDSPAECWSERHAKESTIRSNQRRPRVIPWSRFKPMVLRALEAPGRPAWLFFTSKWPTR
jgi:hypothetical protein